MTTDQLYYAIGIILSSGAVVSLVATWLIERRDREKAQRAAGGPR